MNHKRKKTDRERQILMTKKRTSRNLKQRRWAKRRATGQMGPRELLTRKRRRELMEQRGY